MAAPHSRRRWYARAALLVAGTLAGPQSPASSLRSQPQPVRYTATPVLEFVADAPTLRMPTAVAVAADGRVFVADGVNDRIVIFAPEGQVQGEVRQVGEAVLSNPVGLRMDGQGRLWIADNGHARVVVRAADGSLDRIVAVPSDWDGPAPDVTDVAPTPDGRNAWLVDNDHHRLLNIDLSTGRVTSVGERGE